MLAGYVLFAGGGGSSLVAGPTSGSRFEQDLMGGLHGLGDPGLAYANVLKDGAEFRAGISQAQDWADALTARGPNRGFASIDLLPLLAGVPGSSPYDQWKPEDNHPGLRPDWKDDPGTDPIEVIEQLQLPIELANGGYPTKDQQPVPSWMENAPSILNPKPAPSGGYKYYPGLGSAPYVKGV